MRGLIIRQPWIDLILAGEKTWEMRSQSTQVRGEVGLIRAKSGLVVGTARLVESKSALTRQNYMDFQTKHAIPEDSLEKVLASGWVYPWVLENVRPLASPVRYLHKSGAVIFFDLDAFVSESIAKAIRVTSSQSDKGTAPFAEFAILPRASSVVAKPRPSVVAARTRIPSTNGTDPMFAFRPEQAQAFGTLHRKREFLVLEGSTAMRSGSPNVKRDTEIRDLLVSKKVLVPDTNPRLYRFARDHVFSSASKAAGVIKDGNASGPSLWKNEKNGETLRDYLRRSGAAVEESA